MSNGAEPNQDGFGLIGTDLAVKVLKTPPEFNEEARLASLRRDDIRLAIMTCDGAMSAYLQRSGEWAVVAQSDARQLLTRR